MIVCPHCGAAPDGKGYVPWKQLHRCPIDPANDKFVCLKCGEKFSRYDPPTPKNKRPTSPRDRQSLPGSGCSLSHHQPQGTH